MKKLFTIFGFLVLVATLRAQNGEISGKVLDENGEGVIGASVVIVDAKGTPTGRGTVTDFDGNYSLKPLTPGKYNVQYSYVGYAKQVIQGIVVYDGKNTFQNVTLKPSSQVLGELEVVAYKVPLIDPGKTSSQNVVTAEEIANMPTRNVTDIAATTAGAFQSDIGAGISIRGGREEATEYYIDGVKVTGVPTLPATSIEQLQVITGGVPARFGDATGGIVNITSKGPSGEFNGAVEVQTSQFLDAYGFNLINGNITGPIWKDKKSNKTRMGFFASFEYLYQLDQDPSAVGVWQVRKEKLDSLRQFPLLKKETAKGFNLAAENLTFKDMYRQKVKPNTSDNNYRATARLDFRPVDNITLATGGSLVYRHYHDWIEKYTLLNSENNPYYRVLNWRVFGRFTHNIQGRQEDTKDGKKSKPSAFQNAFYTIQFDYEKFMRSFEDESHGTNPFNYGYIGKFDIKQTKVYAFDTFAIDNMIYQGWKHVGYADTAVLFTPGNLNPYGTRFTQQYYEMLNAKINEDGSYQVFGEDNDLFTSNINQIQANQALINGQRSQLSYNIWYNTGRQYNGFGRDRDNDQYRVRIEGAFDILKPGAATRNKHSFELGIEFEQRIERFYQVSPLGLWQRARLLANQHLDALDLSNPTFIVDGQSYTYEQLKSNPNVNFFLNDTITFNRLYNAEKQTYFDKQLRKSLGLAVDNTDFINIDAISPDKLSLEMFSPEELLLDGSALVFYRGYDPYGNRLSRQPSYYDFYTKKREDGQLERAIPAYRPIYAAAYISDRFYFKDLTFNIGLRVDRFDANQPVLRDEYSLYPINTVSEVTSLNGNPVTHPGNMGGDFKVYVDDTKQPTRIVGYRSGATWYDRFGNEVATANAFLSQSGGKIQPYLKDKTANVKNPDKFDPTQTFTDYKPQFIVMPRLQFSFNLTDRALFFAHYDILSQRPQGRNIFDPTDYLFWADNIGTFNNPNLRPERTVDFQLGFKQKVSNTSAVTISAFYREFRDQIQIRRVINAYPIDYTTYANIDFGTTKGVSIDYDLRRTGNFSMKANYTLQFAEGTGSDDRSQLNLINSNQPNFRTINPLNYDSRHIINLNLNYEYGSGRDYNGPVIKNKQILSNSGINVQFAARSGTPYTEQQAATPEGIEGLPGRPLTKGSINGARLPWYFRVNTRVWKNFEFLLGKKTEGKDDRRSLDLQVYLQIQNLLNTKNVISVYRYTGTPDDDGYLSDPSSLSAINAALNPIAYQHQYAAYINRGDNYALPRRIFFGAILSF
ncbi:MAG: carboxypeptidase regulatory-like domain-containing protein [Chitinophagales bacterium]|nr:carboxypeptidase regulatory-like domain-containing protein [Chitinophagales bacterium]MDW8419080.1 carboxypeptidase regulatory-like domain-containing protein [Chitinophagales bacterium]